MTTINCTQKLAKRLPFEMPEKYLPVTTRLGPWCANTFNIGRFPCIILTNEQTLLTVLVVLKEIKTLYPRFLSSLEWLLRAIGVQGPHIDQELKEMHSVQFARNTNRSTLGSMNDFVLNVKGRLYHDPNLSLEEISLGLSEIPCGPKVYRYPGEETLKAFQQPAAARN